MNITTQNTVDLTDFDLFIDTIALVDFYFLSNKCLVINVFYTKIEIQTGDIISFDMINMN